MRRSLVAGCMAVWLLLTAACATYPPAPDPITSSVAPTAIALDPVATPVTLPDHLIALLKAFLSQNAGISVTEIGLKQAEAINWTDSCLGVPRPDELCAQAITPGYRVVFTTPQGDYTLHSNQTGRSLRLAQSP